MKKLVVAGISLAVLGAVAFAAVRIGVYGVCPLTGEPICCAKPPADAPAAQPASRP